MEITTELWQHQLKLVSMLNHYDKVWWISGMGTGKTLTALKAMEHVGAKRILVITPKAVLGGWLRNIAIHTQGATVTPMIGTAKDKARTAKYEFMRKQASIYVANYETTMRMPLHELGFDMVILDESHKLSSYNSQVSLNHAETLQNIPIKVAMTGTPYANSPLAVYGQTRALYPRPVADKIRYPHPKTGKHIQNDIFGHYQEFFVRYAKYHTDFGVNIVDGYRNLDNMAYLLDGFTQIITTKEADVSLPAVQHIPVPFDLSPELRRIYAEVKANLISEIKEGTVVVKSALTLSGRLQQVTSGIMVTDDGEKVVYASPKLEVLGELLDDLDPEPVVIFTRYKAEVEAICQRFPDSLRLTGDVKQHEEWSKGKARLLVSNIQAGAEGVELHRARYAIYYSHTPDRVKYVQSTGRLARPDQLSKSVTLYHLLPTNTIEEVYLKLMDTKEDVEQALMKEILS